MTSVSAVEGAIQRKMRGWGAIRAAKGINSFISNEDMDDINKIKKNH